MTQKDDSQNTTLHTNANFGRDQFNIFNPTGTIKVDNSAYVQKELRVVLKNVLPPDIRTHVLRGEPQRQLQEWLSKPSPLLGIVAVGGFGKSSLAAWAYGEFKAQFQVALWVTFKASDLPTFNQFARWVLQAAGSLLSEQVEDERLVEQLVVHLLEKPCVLVLDQLEALETAGDWSSYEAFLQLWRQRGEVSKVLLTTRQKILDGASWLSLAGFSEEEGLSLLAQHGVSIGLHREALVRAAVGHPMLLKMATRWLNTTKTFQGIEAEDLTFFERLFRQYEGDPEAQVGEIFAVLFGRLSQEQQTLLCGLSVYRQAFGLPEVQAMLLEATEANLQMLVEGGFLLSRGSGCWTLHALMQEFVSQELVTANQMQTAHEKAIIFFENAILPWDGTLESCLAELEIFYHCCELKQYFLADEVMLTCVQYLDRGGYLRELKLVYEQLTCEWQAQALVELESQKRLGWAWMRLGFICRSLGELGAAMTAHTKAQEWFQSIPYPRGEAANLGGLGNTYLVLGEYRQALDLFLQLHKIAPEIDDEDCESAALNGLGNTYQALGQYEKAIEFHSQHYDISREMGDRISEANALGGLGNAYFVLGQYSQAIERYHRQYNISREIGDRIGEANALGGLGGAYHTLGQYQQAIEYCLYQKEIAIDIGNRTGESHSFDNLGVNHLCLLKYQDALEFFSQSLEISRTTNELNSQPLTLNHLGQTHQALGQYQDALEFHLQSLEISRRIGDLNGEACSLFNIAIVLAKFDQHWEALESFKKARQIYLEIGCDHKVKECDTAMQERNRIIAITPRKAPIIGTEVSSIPDWYVKSTPTAPQNIASSKMPLWIYFGFGLVVVIVVWWLKR